LPHDVLGHVVLAKNRRRLRPKLQKFLGAIAARSTGNLSVVGLGSDGRVARAMCGQFQQLKNRFCRPITGADKGFCVEPEPYCRRSAYRRERSGPHGKRKYQHGRFLKLVASAVLFQMPRDSGLSTQFWGKPKKTILRLAFIALLHLQWLHAPAAYDA